MPKYIKFDRDCDFRAKMLQVWELGNSLFANGPFEIAFLNPSKNREQESRYHAMINDFAKQITFHGNKRYSLEVWKAKFVEQFAQEKLAMGEPLSHPGQTTMSLDGNRVISVRPSTRDFRKEEAGEFIEYLYQQGAEMGIQWSEPAMKAYETYKEAK
jgi:hypothetical protein